MTGEYKAEKAGFWWIKVTFKNPELQVHVSPERIVVTRNRRNSAYNWKETLFSVLPGYVPSWGIKADELFATLASDDTDQQTRTQT